MELAFRKFSNRDAAPPAPGEVHIRPRLPEHHDCREMASLVLRLGVEALRSGPGPCTSVVVDATFTHPTFDEMLAATFAMRLLEGQELSKGCPAFARYAALLREGLRPGTVAPEVSLEGVYLAVRNAAGKDADLTDPAVGARFKADWARMAECILKAAADETDPFTKSLFAEGPEFARERAFLARDQEVYRQDVLRGERWLVRVPGGPPQASGLLLRRPTSLLFPSWSRSDREAPAGGNYLFLAVDWGDGRWVFSTDPVQQLPLRPLAEKLQAAEAARDPARAREDPWYDGKHHHHTLVATPQGGTRLSEKEVLGLVRRWLKARSPRSRWAPVRSFLPGAAAVALLAFLIWYFRPVPPPPPPAPLTMTVNGRPVRDFTYLADERKVVIGKEESIKLENGEAWLVLEAEEPYQAAHDARLTVKVLSWEKDRPLPPCAVAVRVNKGQEETTLPRRPGAAAGKEAEFGPLVVPFRPTQNQIRVRITSPDKAAHQIAVEAGWPPLKTAWVLSVGITEYPPDGPPKLPRARHDAEAVALAFKEQAKKVFAKVEPKTLLDREADRDGIFAGLDWLKANATSPYHLAVVTLHGHGATDANEQFFFQPYDYDRAKPGSRFRWAYFLECFQKLPCDVFVAVDCCHAGAATRRLPEPGGAGYKGGVVLFAAALSTQEAEESEDWGHGVLTLALLEGLRSKRLYTKTTLPKLLPFERTDGPVSLRELGSYVEERVDKLVNPSGKPGLKKQIVLIHHSPDFSMAQIAVAENPRAPAP